MSKSIMESAVDKHDRTLITSLKLQDKNRKKWRKDPHLGITLRKQKFYGRKCKKSFYFTELKSESLEYPNSKIKLNEDRLETKCYHLIEKSALEFRKVSRLKDQLHPLSDRATHQTRIRNGLPERLQVEASDILVRAKTDIDPGFFTTIEGRPTKIYFRRREYLKKQLELLLTRASVLEINENAQTLQEKLNEREKILNNETKIFPFHDMQSRNYIYKDFDVTAEVHSREKKAKNSKMITFQKKRQLENLVQIVRCNLYRLEETWRSLKIFQAFLYRVSPLSWRKEHDRIHVLEGKLILNPTSATYEQYRLSPDLPPPSLEELINLFYEVTKDENPPELYFKNPKQLKNYFDFIVELNSNTFYRAMMVEEDCRVLNRFSKEIKNATKKELEKIQNEHNNFIESYTWFENRKNELNDVARKEKNNIKSKVLSDPHIEIRALVGGAYNMLLNPGKLKVGLIVMLNQLSADVSRVLLEVSNLPPALVKRLIFKQEEALLKAQQADRDYKRIERIEKKMKESIRQRVIPKHCKSLRPRSHPPITKKKEEKKTEIEVRDDLYTEDIFRTELIFERIPEHKEFQPEIVTYEIFLPTIDMDNVSQELEESESFSKQSTISLSKLPSTSKSLETVTSSIGLDGEILVSKPISVSLIPNKTIELPPIDTKLNPPKKSSTSLKKPSLVLTDLTRRKISLLTNYDKSFSAGETEHEGREISFIDVVKTTRIKDNLMRWKSIFPSEKEKISKSSLFHKDIPSPDPYLHSVQQKLQHTSKKWFTLKSDITKSAPLLYSSYIPSLPTIPETENFDEAVLDSILPKMDSKLREFTIKYYQHKYSDTVVK